MPAALCRVMEADGRAKRASRLDWTGLVLPIRELNSPISAPGSPVVVTPVAARSDGPSGATGEGQDHEGRPSSASILDSWARRWSRLGWVENKVERLTPFLAMAGVK